jgi:hypothetical protein
MQAIDNPELGEVAREVQSLLKQVVDDTGTRREANQRP